LPDGGEDSHLVVGGNAAQDSYSMTGVLDEVRISARAASSAYVELEFLSMTGGIAVPVLDR
jgi:hypothetical protein